MSQKAHPLTIAVAHVASDSMGQGHGWRLSMLATIGYERSTLADFVATLRLVGTDILIDVRERAQSRRPGFSKSALSAALREVGIDYRHYPELGDPKVGREAARSGNMTLFYEIFSRQMSTQPAQIALKEIEKLLEENSVCLMCFERDHNECHRKIVSDTLETRLGLKAHHRGVAAGAANDSGRRVPHSYQGSTASI